MSGPLADAFNYALGRLSAIEVEGLPEFKAHIAFAPYNRHVESDRDSPGRPFKPDMVVMSLQDARDVYGVEEVDGPDLSRFVGEIEGRPPSRPASWKSILATVEVRLVDAKVRAAREQDRPAIVFNASRDKDQRPEDGQDGSLSAACKIDIHSSEDAWANWNKTAGSSALLASRPCSTPIPARGRC